MTFENYNGKVYKIIKRAGDYTLLEDISDYAYEPFVVAFLLELDEENKGEWNQGRYFQSIEEASDEFERKINK